MAGSLPSARITAQQGSHPHIAPLAPGVDLLAPVRKVSPFLNFPDGSWNFGESTAEADKGGVLGPDADPVTTPTFVTLQPWHSHQEAPRSCMGFLRRGRCR